MTIAVFSDIHGNYVALEKCLSYAEEQGAEAYIFLGDSTTGSLLYTYERLTKEEGKWIGLRTQFLRICA